MGMAASQARLLTITARMHDVEYQAQSIQNAKIQLSTQSDQVYQDYLAALDATTLTIKDTQGNTITANFNNLFGIDAINPKSNTSYALFDDKGRLVVEDDIATKYNDFKKSGAEPDAYAFAMWMLNPNGCNPEDLDLTEAETSIAGQTTNLSGTQEKLNEILQKALDSIINDGKGADSAIDYSKESLKNAIKKAKENDKNQDTKVLEKALEEYEALEKSYKYKLYQQNAEKIYDKVFGEDAATDYFDQDDFNYFVRMYNEIKQAGGCVSIKEFDGELGGNASTDSDWLKNQLSSGKFSICTVKDERNGDYTISTTSTATDSYVGETTTTSIDKKALAKAEAEYEHETKKIDQKDKKYDMELSKLEAERTALKTEYDSVKQVAKDNIERTFGIFS